jgi:putative hydrolase of HD superfamily
MPQNANLEAQIAFLVEVDKLKSVLRRNYVIHGDRRENSAEHSWHVALFAMVLAEYSNEPVDIDRVLRMLVIHDIVEVDAGDTFIYDDAKKENQALREERAADRLFLAVNEYVRHGSAVLWDKIQSFVHLAAEEGFLQN